MYLLSRHKRLTAVVALLILIFSNPPRADGHGGGHGGGGGGHAGGGGGFAGGGHFTGGFSGSGHGSSSSSRPWTGTPGAGADSSYFAGDSPGFPEDMPEARIHRFLQQHLPHPHWVHWFHG